MVAQLPEFPIQYFLKNFVVSGRLTSTALSTGSSPFPDLVVSGRLELPTSTLSV